MGLFSKKKDNESSKNDSSKEKVAASDVSKKEESKKNDSAKANKQVLYKGEDGTLAYKFIVKPWITEKTHELMSDSKYVFKVRSGANKNQVRNAVEKLYGVKVTSINMINIHEKKRRFGRSVGKKSSIRKAVVTLKQGDKIEIFE